MILLSENRRHIHRAARLRLAKSAGMGAHVKKSSRFAKACDSSE